MRKLTLFILMCLGFKYKAHLLTHTEMLDLQKEWFDKGKEELVMRNEALWRSYSSVASENNKLVKQLNEAADKIRAQNRADTIAATFDAFIETITRRLT
jgi:hypothetical protein